jgi:hypothetical protein
VSKISSTAVVLVLVVSVIGLLVYDPSVGQDAVNWVRSQFSGAPTKDLPSPVVGYTPVVAPR